MLALNDIITFLLGLLRDPQAQAAFEQDPQASLAAAGLDGATAQDVRDAQLQLADSGLAAPTQGGHSAGGDDPVREISYTTQHYHVEQDAPDPAVSSVVTIDDRDTVIFNDSFNSDDDVTVIDDSFNDVSDNDTDIDVTTVDIQAEDSFNTTEDNDVVAIQDNDTTTEDNDVVAIQDNDTVVDNSTTTDAPVDDVADPPVDDTADGLDDPAGIEPEPEPEPEPDDLDTSDDLSAAAPVA